MHSSSKEAGKSLGISVYMQLFYSQIDPLIKDFRAFGCQISPTFKFWEMFLNAVEVILVNVRAERSGVWVHHLQSAYSMLPYFFVANKTNYARWTPAYILDMLNLSDEVKSAFCQAALQ